MSILWRLGDYDCHRNITLGETEVILVTMIEKIYKDEIMYIFERTCKVYVAVSYGICYYSI